MFLVASRQQGVRGVSNQTCNQKKLNGTQAGVDDCCLLTSYHRASTSAGLTAQYK